MTSESKTITDIEYRSLSGFQKKFYTSSKEDDVSVRYNYEPSAHSWYNAILSKINVSVGEGGKNYYEISQRYHYLTKVYMVVKTPNIKVNERFKNTVKIAFTPNLMHHIHGNGYFYPGDGVCQKITPKSLDDYRVTYIKDLGNYDRKIGNVKNLTSFTNHIKPQVLKINPPWFFNLGDKFAFPLYDDCIKTKKIRLMYEFNLDLSKLIRILGKDKDSGEFKPFPFDWKYFDEDTTSTIDTPEMWGVYCNISDEEYEFRTKSKNDNIIDYTDIIEITHNDIKKYGQTATIHLTSSEPVFGLSWKAENKKAEFLNHRSNYTTDEKDIKLGYNPISHFELKYGNIPRVSKMEHYHFDEILPEMYFGYPPHEKGYNFFFYDNKPRSVYVGHTVVFDNVSKSGVDLICTLGDTSKINVENTNKRSKHLLNSKIKENDGDLYPDENDSLVDENSPEFKITVILYIRKRLIFNKKVKKLFVISDRLSYNNYLNTIGEK